MYYVAAERDYPPVEPAAANDNASSGAPDVSSGEPDSDDGADDGVDAADDATAGATPAATPRRRAVPLYHRKDCSHPIAMVDPGFEAQLDIQGTGKLRDGRVINTSGSCRCPNSPCYFEIGKAWAMGPAGKLSPFRSVAVDTDVVPLGSLLYVPILDGMQMPGHAPWGGWVHDGCVVAEDRGGGIKGRDIDFFVAKKVYSNLLDHRHHLKRVQVFDGKGWCERKDGKVQRAYRNAM
ncbi:MAG: hypothetical protein H6709_23505 [Kofleriaceae bacterium]|nr:hypothetical protein [Kofleriaceae bacterium]MCB9575053.1 hypothetical protein [Kofleriaceae bacterium]